MMEEDHYELWYKDFFHKPEGEWSLFQELNGASRFVNVQDAIDEAKRSGFGEFKVLKVIRVNVWPL